MKTIKGIIYTIAFAAIFAATAVFLSGCSFGFTTSYRYPNGEKYTAGDRDIAEKIEKIDIDYMNGDVVVTGIATDTVSIRETAKIELDEKRKVHTWVDGTTLYVRYCASASGLDLRDLEKHLEITIPENVTIADFKGDISSGNMDCRNFEAAAFSISSSSGGINAECSAKTYRLHASSGNIYLKQTGESDEIVMDASSGCITAEIGSAGKVEAEASSGDLTLSAESIREFRSSTSSGINELHFAKAPEKANIEASSGNVTIFLPEDSDLSADLEVSSGELNYDLPFSRTGTHYVCGSGSSQMKVHTSSGDISIKTP